MTRFNSDARSASMKRFACALIGFALAAAAAACGKQLTCGVGTVERNDVCVPATGPLTQCPDGSVGLGGICYPSICGRDTKFDPVTRTCVGIGNPVVGCSTICSAPSMDSVCATGTVFDFVSGQQILPTATSHARVLVFDPIAFSTNPGSTLPLKVTAIENQGCFLADGIVRPSSGLIAVAIDDDSGDATFETIAVGAILEPNANVTGMKAYALKHSDVAAWQQNVTLPAGCSSLTQCGVWIGLFLDAGLHPVANASPSRPSDDPPPENVFCFQGGPGALTNGDVSDFSGMCAIVNDNIENHTAVCGPGGCKCGSPPGTACSPNWMGASGTMQGGSAP